MAKRKKPYAIVAFLVRPARIELATLGLGVPCSIQFELRAHTCFVFILQGLLSRDLG